MEHTEGENMYHVGIVGYGTIGKRVADAIRKQKDMELVGITANSYQYRIKRANEKGIPIYTIGDGAELMKNGIIPKGTIHDLLKVADIIVDCCPEKVGAANKEKYYAPANIKAIFQGGEKASVANVSFVAQANYHEAKGKQCIRVVSCNTTGLTRTLHAIHQNWPIEHANAMLVRRGADPGEVNKGPINAIVPTLTIPSHHGPDVKTVLPIEIFTTAIVVPTTLMHFHNVSAKVQGNPTRETVIQAFKNATRIRLLRSAEKINSTAEIMELAKDLGNERGDMMEICVWEESITVLNNEIFFMQAVHQESDVVPESIDAIRAAMGFESAEKSISMTNESLGIK